MWAAAHVVQEPFLVKLTKMWWREVTSVPDSTGLGRMFGVILFTEEKQGDWCNGPFVQST